MTRSLGTLATVAAIAVACSVDKSDIEFLPEGAFQGTGNVGNTGATDSGGSDNQGGVSNKSGSGNGGASTGGGKQMGGNPPSGGAGGMGGSGMGGMPPVTCMHVVADPTQGEIDNLEDGDSGLLQNGGRRGGWYVYNDGSGNQMPAPGPNMPPPMPEMGGAMGSTWAMHTRGGPFTRWGAGLGIVLNSAPGQPPCTYDVSPHDGLRFWVKGTNTDMILRVSLPTLETHTPAQGGTCIETNQQMPVCGDHFGYDFPLPNTWQPIDVSWDELTQKGWGKMTQLRVEHAINIEFTVVRNVQFDFWIDELSFY